MTIVTNHQTVQTQTDAGRIEVNPYGEIEPGAPWDGERRVSFSLPMHWTADELAGALYASPVSFEDMEAFGTDPMVRDMLIYELGSEGVRGAEAHAARWKTLPETDRTTGRPDASKAAVRTAIARMFGVVPSVNTTPPTAQETYVLGDWDMR